MQKKKMPGPLLPRNTSPCVVEEDATSPVKIVAAHKSDNYSWACKMISPPAALSWNSLSQTSLSFSPWPHLYLYVAVYIPRCKMKYSIIDIYTYTHRHGAHSILYEHHPFFTRWDLL